MYNSDGRQNKVGVIVWNEKTTDLLSLKDESIQNNRLKTGHQIGQSHLKIFYFRFSEMPIPCNLPGIRTVANFKYVQLTTNKLVYWECIDISGTVTLVIYC